VAEADPFGVVDREHPEVLFSRRAALDHEVVRDAEHVLVQVVDELDVAQRLRPDAVTEADDREHYQENAAAVADGLYLVPKVIE